MLYTFLENQCCVKCTIEKIKDVGNDIGLNSFGWFHWDSSSAWTGRRLKARIKRRQTLVPVVITMFPMAWNAKNKCFLYYKDINLFHCKAISIYNAHVWKSCLLCHSFENFRDLVYCIVLHYSQSIICSPLVFQHVLKNQFKQFYSYLMVQSSPTN